VLPTFDTPLLNVLSPQDQLAKLLFWLVFWKVKVERLALL
jgi:hypothetical protein